MDFLSTCSRLWIAVFIFGLAAGNALSAAQRVTQPVDDSSPFVLKNSTRPVVARNLAVDKGPVSASRVMPRMSLHFAMTAEQQADLEQLLRALQDRRAPEYHHFLTPEQYASRFGLGASDISKITRWLEESGFSDVHIARSHAWVSFSGTAGRVESAFGTPVHLFSVNGVEHFANTRDPRLPKALAGVVGGIAGLNNFSMKPQVAVKRPHYTDSSNLHYLAPDDWATIYDVKPLYSAGLDGSGVTIAVVGQSDVNMSDISAFRNAAGLPANTPTVVIPPGSHDPGIQNKHGDQSEADLDLEWSGGIAKNASILFITASETVGAGVEEGIKYAIDNNVAPILSISFGLCEQDETQTEIQSMESLFQQASAQGMTVVASSGDIGAAACDIDMDETSATLGLAVNYPASSAYVTAVGGTELDESSGLNWTYTNNGNGGSATAYIPEETWNDAFGYTTGGGVSKYIGKPAWQTGIGVPQDNQRDVPDVAFTASVEHDGILICGMGSCVNGFEDSTGNLNVIGGTSAGAPTFAGVLALVIQSHGAGTRLGNINPNIYSLAQFTTNIFHDVTQGSNTVACVANTPDCVNGVFGYFAGEGYDLTTGWGSIDAYNFAEQWFGDFQISASPSVITLQPGSSASATLNLTPQNNFSGNVRYTCSVANTVVGITCSLPNGPVSSSSSETVTITADKTAHHPPAHFRISVPPGQDAVRLVLVLSAFSIALLILKKTSALSQSWRFRIGYASIAAVAMGGVSCGSGSTSVSSTPVTPTPKALTLTCNVPGQASVGYAYTSSCTTSGGTAPIKFSVTGGLLAAGLAMNANTGAITGTPTTPGSVSFTVEATDSGTPNQIASQEVPYLNITPEPMPLTVSCNLPGTGNTASGYSGACSTTGGSGLFAYSIVGGKLPAGLTLSSSGGGISGTPTAVGSFSFSVMVTDQGFPPQTATAPVSTVVVSAGQLSLYCSGDTLAWVGKQFYNSCAGGGGTPPLTYSLTGGTLPAGLTLNSTSGLISGVATAAVSGADPLTVTVQDSGSPAQAATYVISNFEAVAPLPVIVSCNNGPFQATFGVPFVNSCTIFGGNYPLQISIIAGSLPPGIRIDSSTGEFTGTPTALGRSTFTIQALDSSTPPQVGQATTSITVGSPLTETGLVTITATSGGIVATTTVQVTVSDQ